MTEEEVEEKTAKSPGDKGREQGETSLTPPALAAAPSAATPPEQGPCVPFDVYCKERDSLTKLILDQKKRIDDLEEVLKGLSEEEESQSE